MAESDILPTSTPDIEIRRVDNKLTWVWTDLFTLSIFWSSSCVLLSTSFITVSCKVQIKITIYFKCCIIITMDTFMIIKLVQYFGVNIISDVHCAKQYIFKLTCFLKLVSRWPVCRTTPSTFST